MEKKKKIILDISDIVGRRDILSVADPSDILSYALKTICSLTVELLMLTRLKYKLFKP